MKKILIASSLFALSSCSQQGVDSESGSDLASIKIDSIGMEYDPVELLVESTTNDLAFVFEGEENLEARLEAGLYNLELKYYDSDNEVFFQVYFARMNCVPMKMFSNLLWPQ